MADPNLGAQQRLRKSVGNPSDLFEGREGVQSRTGRKPSFVLKDVFEAAAARGGRCLSPQYLGIKTKLSFECALGHAWETTPDTIRRGSWCPQCAKVGSSLGERITRTVLQCMFGTKFPKVRPSWLLAGKKRALELDGFAEELSIAFEYHGPQHYEAGTGWQTEKKVAQIQERDALKARLCHERGIRVIIVPDFRDPNDLSGCMDQIEHAVLWAGLHIPKGWQRPTALPSLDEPLDILFGVGGTAALRAIAEDRGGRLVSVKAKGISEPLVWECGSGHSWRAIVKSVRRGSWCPHCAGRARGTIEEMQALAATRGGQCVSTEYEGSLARYLWRCQEGHTWRVQPAAIKDGKWCPHCAGNARLSVLDAMGAAEERGGECLSNAYRNNSTPLKWQCAKGHRWKACLANVLNGSWCPECSGNQKKDIAQMRALAEAQGGKCLSPEYAGVKQHLLWECSLGHRWSAKPDNVIQGTWCRECRGSRGWETRRKRAA
jgi:hypothetical protein